MKTIAMNEERTPVTLTADTVIEFEDGSIVFIERGNPPFKGQWALPGGILEGDESIEETAMREAKEETGLEVKLTGIIGVFSRAGRDPRGRFVSVAYSAVPVGGGLQAATDAKKVMRTSDYFELQLAFDHNQILTAYLEQKKNSDLK